MATAAKTKTPKNDSYLNTLNIDTMTGGIKKVALAGVGAVAVAGDEAKKQIKTARGSINKLASRGDDAQVKSRKALRQFLTDRTQDVKNGAQTVTGRLENQVANIMGKLNVPTKSDIVELTRRIDSLSRKIDRL